MSEVQCRTRQLYNAAERSVHCWTDRMFAGLFLFQWLAGIGIALWLAPRTWVGTTSQVHPHLWAAIVLGGAIISLPLVLVWRLPGHWLTRHTIAVAQMLSSALLIDLTGGRLETHFHAFGSLAFLSFYRDWRVLVTASAVAATEHFFRGLVWPLSIYGTTAEVEWRWLEHAGWVGFIDFFLIYAIRQSRQEMWAIAERQALMEDTARRIEETVAQRTDELQRAQIALSKSTERFELAIRGSNDGIWDWNVLTDEVFYSPRFKELLGFATDEFPGHFSSFKKLLHRDDLHATLEAVHAHITRGTPYDVTYRLRTKLGEWKWFRARAEAIRDANGQALRMAGSMSDISDLKAIESDLRQAASTDKLTGLPNRNLLLDRVQQSIHRAKRLSCYHFALLFLDFDRFKIVNDSLGHDVGDALLQAIANRLRQQVRKVDSVNCLSYGNTMARLGGDEFVILIDELRAAEDALIVADRLLTELAQPYFLGEHEIVSTASIGVALGNDSYERAEHMIRDADTAMYEAKRTGKARYVVFDASMHAQIQRRLRLESDLRKVISANQLHLVYQPIVSLETGALTGVEALLRWQHPTEGLISPAEFIPIAEDTGLILPIGQWVLRESCRQAVAWQREFGSAAPAIISINLSRKQFVLPTLPETIQEILLETGIAPTAVQLEVTESACMDDVASAQRALQALREMGVKLAIDDFGTGYSSLASLHQFPIDVLKIDRSFVNRVDQAKDIAALVHALTVLARNLGMATIAEGIETEAQVLALQELGCKYAQGYLFGKPMCPADLAQWIASGCGGSQIAGAAAFSHAWGETLELAGASTC